MHFKGQTTLGHQWYIIIGSDNTWTSMVYHYFIEFCNSVKSLVFVGHFIFTGISVGTLHHKLNVNTFMFQVFTIRLVLFVYILRPDV